MCLFEKLVFIECSTGVPGAHNIVMVKESQLYFVFSLTSMFRTNPRQRLITKREQWLQNEILYDIREFAHLYPKKTLLGTPFHFRGAESFSVGTLYGSYTC